MSGSLSARLIKQLNDDGPSDRWIEKRERDILFGRTKKVRRATAIRKRAMKLKAELDEPCDTNS